MNPSEVKECLEHLGFDDSELTIGEWWLVFDDSGSGTLMMDDFERMVTARHIIKHGMAQKGSLVNLFKTLPNGTMVQEFDKEALSNFLISLNIDEPRLGAAILLRESRFHADQGAGKADHEIMEEMAKGMEHLRATPQELGEFLYSKQHFKMKFDVAYVKRRTEYNKKHNAIMGANASGMANALQGQKEKQNAEYGHTGNKNDAGSSGKADAK